MIFVLIVALLLYPAIGCHCVVLTFTRLLRFNLELYRQVNVMIKYLISKSEKTMFSLLKIQDGRINMKN
jgi:uncharacterized membrane protein